MRIAVFGHLGFVGSATVPVLKKAGHDMFGYDLLNAQDIRDEKQVEKFFEETRPDRALLLAAVARFAECDVNPKLAHETNVLGTMNVAKVAGKYHIPLVYASTGSCYMPITKDPPITEDFPVMGNSVYGVTKTLGELYVRDYASSWIILRYSHLYGATKKLHGLVGGLLDRIERGMKPKLFGGAQSNDFCYVKDIAQANLLALNAPPYAWNQAYNIGTGEELSAESAASIVCKVFGYTGETERIEQRTVDPQRFVYDTNKAFQCLGFKAQYTFKQGLLDMKSDTKYRGGDERPGAKARI